METRKEIKFLIWTVVLFLTAFFLPVNSDTLMTAIHSTLDPEILQHRSLTHEHCDNTGDEKCREKAEDDMFAGIPLGEVKCGVNRRHQRVAIDGQKERSQE